MYGDYDRRPDGADPVLYLAGGATPARQGERPASSASEDRSDPAGRSSLQHRLGGQWAYEILQNADVIYAVDIDTGERCGLFYGDPALESLPIVNPIPCRAPAVLEVPVDRDSDELETLAEMVDLAKGSCSFVLDLRKVLEKPHVVDDLESADIIYAVDGATNERCGLFHGDPTTESLPIYQLQPWRSPVVMEVPVNALSDDREVLADAVRDLKGSCCWPADAKETHLADHLGSGQDDV